jgi:hypothetical protein
LPVMALEGRTSSLDDVFHPRANGLFPFRVREDVELVLPESIEDGIGDFPGRHPDLHQLTEGFPTCLGCTVGRLRRQRVPRTVPR